MTSEFKSRLGRCYQLAFNEVVGLSNKGQKDAILVHGVIRDTHLVRRGAVICHAWVELDGNVWEPISQDQMSIDVFMRLYDAEIVHRYTTREAVCMALDTDHSGPWAEMPDDIQKTLGQIEAERAAA